MFVDKLGSFFGGCPQMGQMDADERREGECLAKTLRGLVVIGGLGVDGWRGRDWGRGTGALCPLGVGVRITGDGRAVWGGDLGLLSER